MNISENLQRIIDAKNALKTAIEGKGVQVPEGARIDQYAELVDDISIGSDLSVLEGDINVVNNTSYIEIVHGLGCLPKKIIVSVKKAVKGYRTDYVSYEKYNCNGFEFELCFGWSFSDGLNSVSHSVLYRGSDESDLISNSDAKYFLDSNKILLGSVSGTRIYKAGVELHYNIYY